MAWSTIKTDTFTGSNAFLSSYDASWVDIRSDIRLGIYTNILYVQSGTGSALSYWNATTNNDQAIQAKATVSNRGAFVAGRITKTGDNNYSAYVLRWNTDGTMEFLKVSAGTWTQLSSFSASFTTNDVMRLEITGTSTVSLVAKKNGTQVGTTYTDSSSPLASGFTGLGTASGDICIDDFQADDDAGGGGSTFVPQVIMVL